MKLQINHESETCKGLKLKYWSWNDNLKIVNLNIKFEY